MQACLEAKAGEASEPCKKHLADVKGWQGALVAPCRFGLVVLCAEVEPGGGRLAACLEGKKDRLTSGCKDRVGKPATPSWKARQAWKVDRAPLYRTMARPLPNVPGLRGVACALRRPGQRRWDNDAMRVST